MLGASILKTALSERRRESIRGLLRFSLGFVPHRHRLDVLALKYGTDKRGHGYLPHYQRAFAPLRKRKLNLLEIGVGGYDDPKSGGASLRMWQDFFPKAKIHALDIHDKSPHADKRIRIFRGSQADPEVLRRVAAEIGQLDIVIDDGSHLNEHLLISFQTLFPLLADGGIYALEDLHTSYWPSYGGSATELNSPATCMSMLKTLADGLNHQVIPGRSPGPFDASVVGLELYPSLVFVRKGNNRRQLPPDLLRQLEEQRGR